jgi:tetratricopeptide (TPR) repeat protein
MTKVRFILLAGLLVIAAMTGLAGCRSAHTTSAILYIDERNYDKAVQVIFEGFEYRDDEPDAYYYLAEAYSHLAEDAVGDDDFQEALKNYKLAYDAYSKVVALDEEHWGDEVAVSLKYNYSTRERQARVDWEGEFYDQAEGHFRLAYAALPDSLSPVKSLARMKMQMSQVPDYQDERDDLLGEALALLDDALDLNPDAYNLQIDKASVLDALERNDEARAIYDRLLREHGDDDMLLLNIASLAIDDKDWARAADFYVQIVDLREKDTDALNDDDNKDMLLTAGTWYAQPDIARFDDALHVLDRAANMETDPTIEVLMARLQTYYNYGMMVKAAAKDELDPAVVAEADLKAKNLFTRAQEVGIATTNTYSANANAFFYLSAAQMQLGDFASSDINYKTYEELSGGM